MRPLNLFVGKRIRSHAIASSLDRRWIGIQATVSGENCPNRLFIIAICLWVLFLVYVLLLWR